MLSMTPLRHETSEWTWIAGGFAGLSALVVVYTRILRLTDPTIAALSFLLIVFAVSAQGTLRAAIATSLGATASFNYFFLPPTGTFAIAGVENWFVLFTFLVASVLVSRLSSLARERAHEAEARRNAELRSALLASLSHELRTPLTVVTVAAKNLDAATLSPSERGDQVDLIQTELKRLNRLFENFVEMARVETRAVTPEKQWVQPAEIVETAQHQLAHQLAGRAVTIDADERAVVNVDPRLTSTATAHLVENAAQYSPPGSPIDVSAWIEAGELRVSVRDHGPGLPASELQRVFETFYRGTSGSTRPGTGMGLAITRGLVAAQGGRVWAENHPSGGALFTLAVPTDLRVAAEADEDPE